MARGAANHAGGQPHYSALAITTALTMRTVFGLALRQTEGLIATVWTYDIYKPLINKRASDSHYVSWAASRSWSAWLSRSARPTCDARTRHHGLRASAFQHLYRAAARRDSLRHVLEAGHAIGRVSSAC